MKTSIRIYGVTRLRKAVEPIVAVSVLALLGALAHAEEFDQITIIAHKVKVVSHEAATGAPIEKTLVSAKVAYDPTTLTQESGVQTLKDSVLKAAQEVCTDADPLAPEDGDCVDEAVRGAQPQIDAAVARARSQTANR
jgi:UrcA family protein